MSDIEVAVADHIATVTLNRPQLRNPMTLAMWQGIARIFGELGADPEVRAIILTGAGGNFSVGADISEFGAVRHTVEQSVAYEVAVDASSDAIQAAGKPTIAVVEGYCLGGGCHLSMSCDFRFAGPSAMFGIPAARLSIIYGVRSTQRLLSLVGLTEAKRILFTADRIDAERAVRIGFAQDLAVDPMASALEFAGRIAQNAPLSVSGAKYILDGLAMGEGALDVAEAQRLIDAASSSDDYQEGRTAFAEKRPPRFMGR
ncbi:enoyl-CoA hydratase-related protein [Xanthobacter tagetidis]|uniref:3-hydroxybutyryl-CoA dehydratase n=1 Tax=Xanthobacter tagetidis TaxID=60216 RepID=A0A3L7AM40_9HYPH|nr:enoyl-CoA hydratase-related protein [Xanthobacter tagetidis]MBB6307908.1 enoyl-CoA hydratase/carnithine racemase [Xanthobacter tagetidis]RLP81563.1 3-hydroxybutyryl-CoA dehydratase [Xanthobacter tagetidis]